MSVLVVVPCGKQKIWQREPLRGPVPAREAYTSGQFRTNRRYAELYGDDWVVLSAMYGFVSPEFPIPGPYDVTFTDRSTKSISGAEMREQVEALELGRFGTVVGLGGKEYRTAVARAFAGTEARVVFPFAGSRSQGEMNSRTKKSIASGDPGFAIGESDG
jgi:hypothetical protein